MIKTLLITPAKLTRLLSAVVLFLLLANLSVIYLHFALGFGHLRGFLHGFYFDTEVNFPSFYSACAILLSSAILWLVGSTDVVKQNGQAFHWKFMSFVFVFLAIDEFASVHEYLIQPAGQLLDEFSIESDYLHFGWFIPYGLLMMLVVSVFLKVLFKLAWRTKLLFILSGIIYVTGAVVMEMIGGKYWAEQGWSYDGTDPVDIQYALIITVEELLEMSGIVLFIHALSGHYLSLVKERSILFRLISTGQTR